MRQQNTYKDLRYIVGIDEAGRGPLAGPVAVGAFCVAVSDEKDLKKLFKGARDSKKMSVQKREEIFEKIKNARSIQYIVVMENAKTIDAKGISWAIRNCIKKSLAKLSPPDSVARSAKRGFRAKIKLDPKQTLILLDGGIKAPIEFTHQRTIIRGDDKEVVISLASIVAKVTRDAHMRKMAKKYPRYGLELHKGYGTLRHRTAIRKYGPSAIHRKTYLKNI